MVLRRIEPVFQNATRHRADSDKWVESTFPLIYPFTSAKFRLFFRNRTSIGSRCQHRLPFVYRSRSSSLACLKRLYLQIHAPELAEEVDQGQHDRIEQGHEVGLLAQRRFSGGVPIAFENGIDDALANTAALSTTHPFLRYSRQRFNTRTCSCASTFSNAVPTTAGD